ncbi:response regulator transcription factor [uncultured Gemella sp.]|uniref:response regulator transcription factor n=1 Tax=uncultured Gemella sp. TaxID=254352 RepID=UPI0028D3994E|nr:response regulator transcription factor [uncultured Gemella sp.]
MKILLIDDHKLIKIGIKVLLEDDEKISVIDDCASKTEFLEKIKDNIYNLFICDISLPDGSGYDILEIIKEKKLDAKVIILSMHEDKSYIKKAFRLGASGYVTKSTAHEEILQAIEKVIVKDEIYLNDKYAKIFYELFKEDKEIELSEREKEVGRYIVEGYTLTDIGEKLFLSVKTVDTYKKRLMEKTNTKKRSELVEYLKNNLIL